MSPVLATLCGFCAILLWGALAVLSALAGPVPSFQTTAVAFAVGGTVGVAVAIGTGRAAALRPTPAAFALGLCGLFVYHALYFAALKLAPPAEANLVASLWAMLIVLLSALLPGHRLQARHVAGALIGFAGAALLIWPRLGGRAGEASALAGLALAAVCALVWSSYSVASRLVAAVPTESVAVSCLATSALAALCHLALETTVWPQHASEWIGLLGLGLGPVGAAFYLWDIGMKRGDVSLLGVLSYAQPVIATALLVALGLAAPSVTLAVAVALVVAGATIASWPAKA